MDLWSTSRAQQKLSYAQEKPEKTPNKSCYPHLVIYFNFYFVFVDWGYSQADGESYFNILITPPSAFYLSSLLRKFEFTGVMGIVLRARK